MIAGTLVHLSDKTPFASVLNNQTSELLILLLAIVTFVFGAGCDTEKLWLDKAPCTKYKKYPVFCEPKPCESFLYKNESALPGTGASSYKNFSFRKLIGAISKGILTPFTFLVNW